MLELQKENEWSLGKKLKIDELEFTELDEIFAVYIDQMMKFVKTLMEHPKYKSLSQDRMCIS